MNNWEIAWNEATVAERKTVRRWTYGVKNRSGLRGGRNQCPTCGEFFAGLEAFDAHRTGDWGKPKKPSKRRCLTLAEMVAEGFTRNEYFYLTKYTPRKAGGKGRGA